MSTIKPYQDLETRRQYKNHTYTQQKVLSEMKEGLVVNNMIKEPLSYLESGPNLDNMYDNLIIPDRTRSVESKNEETKPQSLNKSLKPLLLVTLGVFGLLAGGMVLTAQASKKKMVLPEWKTLPEVPKNIAINSEPHFATYTAIQDPNKKTLYGALGVFVLGAIGLVGKNFVDGVKAIWIRKKEADVQRNLQEKLIAVETKSFSGKMQIQRNMLNEKAKELNEFLHKNQIIIESPVFKKFINFHAEEKIKEDEDKKESNKKAIGLVAISTVVIAGLGFLAFKNVQKLGKFRAEYTEKMQKKIGDMVEKSDLNSNDQETLKSIFVSMNLPEKDIRTIMRKAKNAEPDIAKNFTESVIQGTEKLSQKGAEAIAGTPGNKPAYYSHTNDDRAHLYNMIMNWENPVLKILFAGMSGVTVAGYVGTQAVEAVRSVQVIKENANTELDLQKRLVAVDIKNFETKKKSVIDPLVDEFKTQALKGKDKNELKTRAENILYEIKNGPPFVYS